MASCTRRTRLPGHMPPAPSAYLVRREMHVIQPVLLACRVHRGYHLCMPNSQDTHLLLGLASTALECGHLNDAIELYSTLVERLPGFAEGFYKRGNAYNRLGRFVAALADYDQAVALDPSYANAFCNRGTVLERLERWDEALSSYDRALSLNPQDSLAHYNRASVLRALDRIAEALQAYDRALALNPKYVEALVNRGHLLHKLARPAEAAASYARALALVPMPRAANDGAIPQLRPEQKFLLGLKRHMQIEICDWADMQADVESIAAGLRAGLPVIQPWPALAILDDPALQRRAAASWVQEEYLVDPPLPRIVARPRSDTIRVGYFSPDFCAHPVMELAAGVFESHDRSRFEITALAFGPDTRDELRTRLEGAFDRWIDLRGKSDRQAALLAREAGIDIAVDLAGFTNHSRFGIFAFRAAPHQVSYLGYPGTTGADCMDYLVADLTLVPPEQQPHYAEKIIYLPNFQANDSKRRIADRQFHRDELGLPPSGFVYCCLNSTYKIMPGVFACWMRILVRVPDSVLLVYTDSALTRQNLRTQANEKGVDPDRIVFARRLPLAEYRASYRTANLFLDTLPFNGGTTVSDALWAGLPVLTCEGSAFAGRMAASLLRTIGVPELVTTTLAQYEELAVQLAEQPARLADLRQRLAQNRLTTPLFDTRAFTRHLESGYASAWQRHVEGLPPANIRID